MKKTIIKLLIIIGLISSLFIINTNAGAINIGDIDTGKITSVTINKTGDSDVIKATNDLGFSLLKTAKVILQAILVVYIVYVGGKMIMSMGADDGDLKKAKDQLRYSLVAIVFINVPGVIYEAITLDKSKNIGGVGDFTNPNSGNILVNMNLFKNGLLANIIDAIEVLIFTISVYVLIMAGIKMMTARGRDEKIKEAKEKLLYSLFAMMFVGFIEAWKQVAITGKLSGGTGSASYIFSKAIDMALLFAGPVAMIFLTYAGYIYITANGEEDKVKKAKSIILNTLIATIILLVMVTFLNDLITLV